MKNLALLFSVLILVFISCDDFPKKKEKVISVSELRKLVPYNLLSNSSRIVYKNTVGQTKKLEIQYIFEELTANSENSYTTEKETFTLIDPENDEYSISIQLNGILDLEDKIDLFITCSLVNKVNGIFESNSITLRPDNNNNLFAASELGNIELNNSQFENAYSNVISVNEDHYSNIYYNFELGAIGFTDRTHVLWNLESFE